MSFPTRNIPAIEEMAELDQWVLHRAKKPFQTCGQRASSTDPTTWARFDQVDTARQNGGGFDGVGFVFTQDDNYVGIDIDDCIVDGVVADWAAGIVANFQSYTEISLSGTGLHIIARGAALPKGFKRTSPTKIEVYSSGRYFTVTGTVYGGFDTIEDRGDKLSAFVNETFPQAPVAGAVNGFIDLDADFPQEKFAVLLANSSEFRALWERTRAPKNDDSLSGYDLALCSIAVRAEWTDAELAALIRHHRDTYSTAAKDRTKARRRDYVEGTVAKAQPAESSDGRVAGSQNGIDPDAFCDLAESPHEDVANGHRVARYFGSDLRWTPGLDWLTWDEQRWVASGTAAWDRVQELGRYIGREAAELERRAQEIADDAQKKKAEERAALRRAWAKTSESETRRRRALKDAQGHLRVEADELDADPHLLNVANGTIDLRSGDLLDHRREDLITKVSPVVYDRHATLALWKKVLERALPEPDLRDYVQLLAGYTALGRAGEDVLPIPFGPTRSAKGTVQHAIATALGPYAVTASLEDLAESKYARPGQARPELVRLRGARMVNIYETSARLRLSASLIKTLTGSDPISVRELYGKTFEYVPSFTPWIATNHRPQLPDDDPAVWERVREIRFRHHIPESERDKTVRQRLTNPSIGGPAVLAWIVEGARLYLKKGLDTPLSVRDATAEYREAMDPIGDFLEAACVLSDGCWVSSHALRTEYERWCKETGEREPLRGKAFGERLRSRGCDVGKRYGQRGWVGIGLRNAEMTPR